MFFKTIFVRPSVPGGPAGRKEGGITQFNLASLKKHNFGQPPPKKRVEQRGAGDWGSPPPLPSAPPLFPQINSFAALYINNAVYKIN